jgi:hypothetical protein
LSEIYTGTLGQKQSQRLDYTVSSVCTHHHEFMRAQVDYVGEPPALFLPGSSEPTKKFNSQFLCQTLGVYLPPTTKKKNVTIQLMLSSNMRFERTSTSRTCNQFCVKNGFILQKGKVGRPHCEVTAINMRRDSRISYFPVMIVNLTECILVRYSSRRIGG